MAPIFRSAPPSLHANLPTQHALKHVESAVKKGIVLILIVSAIPRCTFGRLSGRHRLSRKQETGCFISCGCLVACAGLRLCGCSGLGLLEGIICEKIHEQAGLLKFLSAALRESNYLPLSHPCYMAAEM